MADKKISQLSAATTPLAGTEVLPIVQSGATVKVSAADLTAGRSISTAGGSLDGAVTINDSGADVDFRVESDTNTHALFVQGSDGNLGIGTSSPNVGAANTGNAVITLTGASTGQSGIVELQAPNTTTDSHAMGLLRFFNGTNENARIEVRAEGSVNDAANIQFETRATGGSLTERLRITSAGLVGIGTSSPSGKLDVYTSATRYQAFTTSAADLEIVTSNNTNPAVLIKGTGTADLLNVFDNTTEVFTILDGGNVGIGTTSPGAKLSVDGSAIFNESGADVDFRVESDTNTHALFVEGTNSNVKIGGSEERATTVGSHHLDIFNGIAPVGTLSNGISLYSSSGEAYVMDAAGNATLFSPHDSETNEWIFRSKHTPTGKVLKIDVEKMLRFINEHFGLDAIHEFTE